MNKHLNRMRTMGIVFKGSFKTQLLSTDTIEMAAAVGLYQGLKYNGDLKRGLNSAAITALVLSTVNGVKNVAENWDAIIEISDRKDGEY